MAICVGHLPRRGALTSEFWPAVPTATVTIWPNMPFSATSERCAEQPLPICGRRQLLRTNVTYITVQTDRSGLITWSLWFNGRWVFHGFEILRMQILFASWKGWDEVRRFPHAAQFCKTEPTG